MKKLKESKRIEWIDLLKGFAIICVFMGHQIGRTSGSVPTAVGVWIYSFHMPLFFFLSGVTFSIDKYKSFQEFLISKCKTLLIPMAFFTVVFRLFDYLYYGMLLGDSRYSVRGLIETLKQLVIQENPCLWFLPCLFVAEIMLYWIVRLCKNKFAIMGVAAGSFILGVFLINILGDSLPWKIDTALIVNLFIIMGYLFKKYQTVSVFSGQKIWGLMFLAINVLATYFNYVLSNNKTIDLNLNQLGNPILFLIESVSGICAIYILVKDIKGLKIIKYIGRNSIIYYGLGDLMDFVPDIIVYNILHLNVVSLGNWGVFIIMLYAFIICVCIWPMAAFISNKMKFVLGKF